MRTEVKYPICCMELHFLTFSDILIVVSVVRMTSRLCLKFGKANVRRSLWVRTVCFLCAILTRIVCTHTSLQWCQNEHNGVSNDQPRDCLLNRLFRRRSKETSKLSVSGLCARNSPVTGEFPTERASYTKNVSIWWRHNVWVAIVMYAVGIVTCVCLVGICCHILHIID